MSNDIHDKPTCWTCGKTDSPDIPCECNCDHAEFSDGLCTLCGYECEHDDIEDSYCIACGEDRTEDMMAAAYDYMKGRHQDGY